MSVAFHQFFALLRLFRFGIAEQLSKIARQTAPHFESEIGLDACGRARMYARLSRQMRQQLAKFVHRRNINGRCVAVLFYSTLRVLV